MNDQSELKAQLWEHLKGGQAFVPLNKAIEGIDHEKAGTRAPGISHSIHELVFHLHVAMKDILDYIMDENYTHLKWPDDYWPGKHNPSKEEWQNVEAKLWTEMERAESVLKHGDMDLFAQIPWGKEGHTKLRGIMLIIEHNAYHTGQILDVRKAIGEWK